MMEPLPASFVGELNSHGTSETAALRPDATRSTSDSDFAMLPPRPTESWPLRVVSCRKALQYPCAHHMCHRTRTSPPS